MKIIVLLLGGVLGLAFARLVLLSEVEVVAWRFFWSGLAEGRVVDPGILLGSTTFWKSVAALVVFATAGLVGCRLLWERDDATGLPPGQ